MTSQKTPREEAAKKIATGLVCMLRWSNYQDEFEQMRCAEGVELFANGIAEALSLLRGEQEAERGSE